MRASFLTQVALATAVAAMTAASGARADDKKAEQKFCSNVVAADTNLSQLEGMVDSATVGQVHATTARIESNTTEMKKATKKMKTPAGQHFEDAVGQLNKEVSGISSDDALAKAREKVKSNAREAQSAAKELANEASCPTTP
ncbi:MAG: hypothetical protein ACRENE_09080 [Polyangiaceae bacterium]